MSVDYRINLIDKITAPLKKAIDGMDKLRAASQKTNSKLKLLPNSIDQLEDKLKRLRSAQKSSFTVQGILKYKNEIRATERELQRLNKIAGTSKNNLSFGGMITGGAIAYGAFRGFKQMISLSSDLEQSRVTFETMLGSSSQADQMINNLNDFANATPFNNTALYDNAKLLLNFGMNDASIIPTLKMLGDVSGGSKEKLDSLTLAFAQIQSQGKLTGQDLLQMINAGFNPLQELSQMTGKSMATLKDEMSKGLITSEMVTQAFQHTTSEGGRFFGMMEKQSQTAAGKWSTLVGKVQLAAANFGTKLLPMLTKVVDKLILLVDWISRNIRIITRITAVIATSLIVFKAINIALKSYQVIQVAIGIATKVWTAAQWLLNIALNANPISLIVIGIALLIGAIVIAWNKSEKFRATVLAVWETMKGWATFIKDILIHRLKAMLQGLGAIGKAMMHIMKGDFKAAWESTKSGAFDLFGGSTVMYAKDRGQGLGKNWAIGYQKGIDSFAASQQKTPGKVGTTNLMPGTNNIAPSSDLIAASGIPTEQLGIPTGSSFNDAKGAATITSGGSKQTNINITIGNLVEGLTFSVTNIKESTNQLRELVQEELLRAVNSVSV